MKQVFISSKHERVELSIVGNPKKLKAGSTYQLIILDKENLKSDFIGTTDNGTFKVKQAKGTDSKIYEIELRKAGPVTLRILSKDEEGKFIMIDVITLK